MNSIANIKQSFLHMSLYSTLPHSKFNLLLCKVLYRSGLINYYKVLFKNNKKYLLVYLKYFKNRSVITDLKSISKSSRYITTKNKNVFNKKQSLLISTSNKGLYFKSINKKYRIGGNALTFINC
jgi:ribosomal protein S8